MSKYLICSSDPDVPIHLADDLNSALLWVKNAAKVGRYVNQPTIRLYQISDSPPLTVHFADKKMFID